MLQQAYGEDCLIRTQCHEWYQRFKQGRTSIEDDPKYGQPSTSMDDDHGDKVLAVIRQNPRLTVREVAEEAGICKSSYTLYSYTYTYLFVVIYFTINYGNLRPVVNR